jgi:glycosyltransferase involved in cell wall biosynthesis
MDTCHILLSVPVFFPHDFGGGQTYVYRLAKELKRRGHAVTVLTIVPYQGSGEDYVISGYEYDDIEVISVSVLPERSRESEKISEINPILMAALKKIVSEQNADIIHINGIKASLITVCNELNIPYVVTAHHPGFACPVGTLLRPDDSLCGFAASPDVCVPCSCQHKRPGLSGTLLGSMPAWFYRPVGSLLDRFRNISYLGRGLQYPWLIEKRMEGQSILLHKSKKIIAPSKATMELLVRNGTDEDRVILLLHGIAPLLRQPLESISDRKIRFGYFGRIGPAKGFHILVRALQMLDSDRCELHVYGDAQNAWDKAYLDALVAGYKGKSGLCFHGRIAQDGLGEAYRQTDVLVLPTICLEVFGLVILEAFSAGRPVIVTKSGGPAELVRDGVDGFIAERNDAGSMAATMQKFIGNPALIKEMSDNIRPVKTMAEYGAEMVHIYKSIIGEYSDA